MYTTYFNINVVTKTISDTSYEASLYFKEKGSNKNNDPIKFTIDRIKRKVVGNESKKTTQISESFGKVVKYFYNICALLF